MIQNIQEIKQAADIVDIIQESVKLKRNGVNHVGLCPFHSEKTPSFTVSKSKQKYKCFGCGKSGDVIDFIMETTHINYIEAIKFLANKYNIQLYEQQQNQYTKPKPRVSTLSPETIQYFAKRGISEVTLNKFGVTESVEWMPKAKKEIRVICFNYFKNGELVNIKFRGKDKDFMLSSNAELIFYNIDAIKNYDEVVIVEGEIDCLSVHASSVLYLV